MTMHRALAVTVCGLLFVAACSDDGGSTNAPCEEDANCNLSPGGKCVLATTGNKWCAYPDPSCSGGLRFSDQVGDDLGGVCIEGQRVHLAISIDGGGTVASVPEGITCTGNQCAGDFLVGTAIKLVATPAAMPFLGWTGACRGLADCSLTLVSDTTVGAFFGAAGTALWAKQFGGVDFDVTNGIARDSQDNLIIAGRFVGTATFGSTMLTSAGGADIFVAKLSATDGSVLWARKFGAGGQDVAMKVATDTADAIYLAGSFQDTPNFGGGQVTNVGDRDVFVAKLDTSGAYVWAKTFGSTGADEGLSLSVRGGKVAVTGYYSGAMTVGATSLPNGGQRGFAFQLTAAAGGVDWATPVGTSNVYPSAIVLDSAGNSVATGTFIGMATVGSQTLNSAGDKDLFLAKLKGSDGSYLFASRQGGIGPENATSLAIDGSDSIYLGGNFTNTVNFGVGAMTALGNAAFVAKFSLAGSCTWSKGFGGATTGEAAVTTALSVNAAGDVIVVGSLVGTISLGGPPLSSVPGPFRDIFAGRLKGVDGSHVSSIRAGGQGDELTNAVVQTSDGKYFVAGGFDGFADFGGNALTSTGLKDGFVFAMAPL